MGNLDHALRCAVSLLGGYAETNQRPAVRFDGRFNPQLPLSRDLRPDWKWVGRGNYQLFRGLPEDKAGDYRHTPKGAGFQGERRESGNVRQRLRRHSSIKKIADEHDISIILVHHLRKLKDGDDPFNEVSGSTGITGAADTNYVLKRKRSSRDATLLACGRDVEYQELTLRFQDLKWELVERKETEEIRKAEIPQFLFRVVEFMKARTEWVGTATELIADMAETETTPNVVTKYLGQFYYEVLEPAGIEYRTKRTGQSRLIKFIRHDGGDANDGNITV